MTRFASAVVVGLAVVLAACSGGSGGQVGGCGDAIAASAGEPIPSMACASMPPSMSPWPLSEADAIAAANQMGGRTDYAVVDRVRTVPLWLLRASGQFAVADGITRNVLAFYPLAAPIEEGDGTDWPDWTPAAVVNTKPDPAATEAQARAAAVAFLAEHNLATSDGGHVDLDPAPGPPAWRAFIPDADGDGVFEVRVDATTGMVTAFLRSTPGRYIDLPRIDRDTAIRLAIGYAHLLAARNDLHPTAAYPMVSVGDDLTQRVTWTVTVDAPLTADGTSALLTGISFEVDAVTGSIRVDK